MVEKVVKVFVIAGLFAGISYLLHISKIPLEQYVSIPLVLSSLFLKKDSGFARFSSSFLGILVSYGSRALLLSPEAYWRGILVGIGSAMVGGFKSGALRIIIPPILPAVFWMIAGKMVAGIVNFGLTAVILYAIERRERA